ncbi:hypothetical protein BJY01DRAFT_250534 [Aspergillus pseudoustus]|uniref:Zn(2)-C6 fungal-type domain-containing protein n=1 Tax=Aspergillus pseudoustus TaxID=1810923 RepID=A0ABR4JIF4_9EURO
MSSWGNGTVGPEVERSTNGADRLVRDNYQKGLAPSAGHNSRFGAPSASVAWKPVLPEPGTRHIRPPGAMARRGRLSKGCQTCRKRKIKCDRLLPGCTQCRRSGWVCPQYGDEVERMFQYQNQTQSQYQNTNLSTRGKPTRKGCPSLKAVRRTAPETSPASTLVVRTVIHCDGPFLPQEIPQSLTDRAVAYFLHTHALSDSDSNGEVRGFYEYLLTLDVSSMEIPSTCLTAAALAAYGNACHHRPDILKEARRYYGRSLRLVNRALQCREQAKETSTMISILLLNSFEALTSESLESMGYSDGHMRGVMMVMNLRGPGLMHSRQGLQVFLHMCRCLITYCIMRPVRVPEEVISLRRHAAKFLDTKNPAWRLEELMIKLARFRADVEAGSIGDQGSLVDVALRLDDELSQLTSDLPAHWHFDTVSTKLSDPAIPGYYHVYRDFWIAYIWNYARTSRLILHKMIQEQWLNQDEVSACFKESTNVQSQSLKISRQLIWDICASVPQYCDDADRWLNSSDCASAGT